MRLGAVIGCATLWLLVAAPALTQVQAEGAADKLSRFQRTLIYLQDSPAVNQADFADAALAELAAVYMAEADLARSQAAEREGSGRARLLGWSVAVNQYASQLLLMLDDVEQGFPVSLSADQHGQASITIADRTVMLAHPRADQQPAFEQRVLTDFCSHNDCEQMTLTAARPEPIPVTLARVNPLWTFTESGPVCINDSLEIYFHSTRNLAELRGICEEFAQEVVALATAISWQRRHGVEIDWDGLSITPTPGRPGHLVRLNATGDSVLLTLPLLFGSQNLLADIGPWLSARSLGEKPPSVRLDAADYGWLSPAP